MNKTILIVDDEPKIVQICRDYLTATGYRGFVYVDGEIVTFSLDRARAAYGFGVNDDKMAAGYFIDDAGQMPYVIDLPITDPGDIDDSGEVDLADVILGLQVLAGITPAGLVEVDADVDGNGKIGMAEVIFNLQKVSGLR